MDSDWGWPNERSDTHRPQSQASERFYTRIPHTPSLDGHEKPLEDMERENDNREALRLALQDILRPYEEEIYRPILPNQQTIFGKQLGALKPWIDEKKIGNYRAAFRTKLSYARGKRFSTLEKAEISIRHQSETGRNWRMSSVDRELGYKEHNPSLELKYIDGGISSVAFRNVITTQDMFKSMLLMPASEPNKMGVFLDLLTERNAYYEEYDTAIDLSNRGNPALLINPVGRNGRRREYVYSAELNELQLVDSPIDDPKLETISVEDFLGIVKDTLRIIPSTTV